MNKLQQDSEHDINMIKMNYNNCIINLSMC